MTLGSKRVLYSSAILFFFAVTPLILFYSSGYRISSRNLSYEKIGAFFIKSFPSNASITINGVSTATKTPARILNMREGLYRVEVSLEGYIPWVKTLPVYEGTTTFMETIQLFKSSPSKRILSPGGDKLVITDDRRAYAFIAGDNTIVLTTTDAPSTKIISTSIIPHRLLSLSPGSDKIIFISGSGLWLLDTNTDRIKALKIPNQNASKVQWDLHSQDLLWIQAGSSLYTYDLTTGSSRLVRQGVHDFLRSERGLSTLLFSSENTYSLLRINPVTLDVESEKNISLASPDASLYAATNKGVLITAAGSIYHIDDDTVHQFRGTAFGVLRNSLLYSDGFTIGSINLETDETHSIDRVSQKIGQILWHPGGDYILLERNDTYSLIELDSRDVQQRIPIAKNSNDAQVFFNRDGSRLFLLSQQEAVALEIQ